LARRRPLSNVQALRWLGPPDLIPMELKLLGLGSAARRLRGMRNQEIAKT